VLKIQKESEVNNFEYKCLRTEVKNIYVCMQFDNYSRVKIVSCKKANNESTCIVRSL
jgi:hypothetical protein